MKVALISHSLPPGRTGGIGSYTFNLAEELTKKGIDVTVFCGGKVKEELPHKFKIKRLPMINFPPMALWFQIQNFRFFKKELKKFDIIHGQMTCTTFYSFIKKEIGKPWIVTFHDHPKRGLKTFLESPRSTRNFGDFIFNFLEYPIYKKLCDIDINNADKVISVGSSLLDDLVKYSRLDRKKSIIIGNGINLQKINSICKSISKNNSKKIKIVFFGRLFYSKGVLSLISAMKLIISKNKNVHLDIYGEGPLKKSLIEYIEKNKLKEYIHLHNFISNEEVIRKLKQADIFVLPTLYESFGIILIEAMATGTPIVTSDIPDLRSLIKNNYDGILVEPTPEKIAEAIDKIIKNPKLRERLARNGLKEVKKYSWDKIVEQTEKVYEEVLREHNKKLKQKKK